MARLVTVGGLPLPAPSPQPRSKRPRDNGDSDTPSSMSSTHGSPATTPSTISSRPIAGSSRVKHSQYTSNTWSSNAGILQNGRFTLPVHSHELSRMPVHPVFDEPSTSSASPWTSHTNGLPHHQLDGTNGPISTFSGQPPDPNPYPSPYLSSDISQTTPFPVANGGSQPSAFDGNWLADVNMPGTTSDPTPQTFSDNQVLALLSAVPNSLECV